MILHDKSLVLVIDDDEAICTYLSALLEENAVTIEASRVSRPPNRTSRILSLYTAGCLGRW